MSAHLTEAEARALGLPVPQRRRRPTRSSGGRRSARSRCVACGEEFTSDTAETRHVETAGHHRFESVLEGP